MELNLFESLRKYRVLLGVGWLALCFPGLSLSAPIRVDWTGEISPTTNIPQVLTTEFDIGDIASGSFIYDSNAADAAPGPDGRWSTSDFNFTIGSYTATAPGGLLVFLDGPNIISSVTNESFGLAAPDIPAPPEPPSTLFSVDLNMFSPAITSDRLPLPSDADSIDAKFVLFFDGPNGPEILSVEDQTSVSLTDVGGGQIRVDWAGKFSQTTTIPEALGDQFSTGDTANLSFTYDSNAADAAPGPDGRWSTSDFNFTIGSYTATAPGGLLVFLDGPNIISSVTNESFGLAAPDIPAPPEPPATLFSVDLNMFSPTITTDRLPLPSDANGIEAGLNLFFSALNEVEILSINRLSVDITLIDDPEIPAITIPASIWLFGSALIGLAGFRRRKIAHQNGRCRLI